MEHDFWHQRWKDNKIGFHEPKPNPLLVSNFSTISLAKGDRVFLPLCGKTLDIAWLLTQGYQVAGAELSQFAIDQLFQELGVVPKIEDHGAMKHYQAAQLDIFVGDIFKLTEAELGPVSAIYDRAALVALPREMRLRYTEHLRDLTQTAPQLLLTFIYDQDIVPGPPFSISDAEVFEHYEDHYNIRCLEKQEMPDGLKGKYPAIESVWYLS